uniref:Uncharacterized protein n=1 Tax=Arundo donax TaxID=35708 RepID=A0A0A9A5V3_ARUDO
MSAFCKQDGAMKILLDPRADFIKVFNTSIHLLLWLSMLAR